jgi:hypothetical protein
MKSYTGQPLGDPLTEIHKLQELGETMLHAHAKYERAREKFVQHGILCRRHLNVLKIAGTLRSTTMAVNNALTGDKRANPKFLYDIAALGHQFAAEKVKKASKEAP